MPLVNFIYTNHIFINRSGVGALIAIVLVYKRVYRNDITHHVFKIAFAFVLDQIILFHITCDNFAPTSELYCMFRTREKCISFIYCLVILKYIGRDPAVAIGMPIQ